MARVKRSVNGRKHRRAILEEAKGYGGARSRHFRKANEQVMHSGRYAYRDRRNRKRDFRALWIIRIKAAAEMRGVTYSRFIHGLTLAGIGLNRKALSELAIHQPLVFDEVATLVKNALAARKQPAPVA